MKSYALILICCITVLSGAAQAPILQKSPKALVQYRVGMTDVSVAYAAPAVKGRKIWGGIVPHDQVWRAGANEASTVSFSTNVRIGDKEIQAGTYAFFLIPKKSGRWTAILNSDAKQWGAYVYDQTKDIVRINVLVEDMHDHVERLRYHIEDYSMEEGALVMRWEKKQVTMPFYVNALGPAIFAFDSMITTLKPEDRWFYQAEKADILFEFGRTAMADSILKVSLQSGEHVWSLWKKARFLAQKGDYQGALGVIDKIVSVASSDEEGERAVFGTLEAEIAEAENRWKTRQHVWQEINRDIWIPFSQAYAAGDADKYLSLHASDFVRANANGRSTTDLNGYARGVHRSFNRNYANNGRSGIEFRFIERIASDISASERGVYKYTHFPATGNPTFGYGQFHVVSRNENGVWKIVMDYDSDENGSIGEEDYMEGYAIDDFSKW